jgi:hypothetical protein
MDEYDYSDFDWNIQPDDIYGVGFRERFVLKFRVEKSLANAFFIHLEEAMPYAKIQAALREKINSRKFAKGAWTVVSNSATKLINDLNEAEEFLDFGPENDLAWHMMKQTSAKRIIHHEPETSEQEAIEDAIVEHFLSDAKKIIATIEEFSKLAKELLEELPPPRRGPKADHELRFWVQEISNSWDIYLGRKFTRDVDDSGEPISEAAQFVAMATEGTPYEKTSALNMMKKVIFSSRRIDIH